MDILLPFYGGLRGHYAQIKDGAIQRIFKNPNITPTTPPVRTTTTTTTTITPPATTTAKTTTLFQEDFLKIQSAAARLVAIQEMAKSKGAFSSEDNRVYAESLLELGKAAQNLAMLQQTGQIKDFSVLLQPKETTQANNSIRPNTNVSETSPSTTAASVHEGFGVRPEKTTITTITTTTDSSMEFDLLPSVHKHPYDEDNDDVAIVPPKKDAPVAEAKPIGVSIVGEGGVASAKPNAVALSGRNGLAIASPKATAIAGVTAEEAAAFSISLPNHNRIWINNSNKQQQQHKELNMRHQSDYLNNYEDFHTFTSLTETDNKNKLFNRLAL